MDRVSCDTVQRERQRHSSVTPLIGLHVTSPSATLHVIALPHNMTPTLEILGANVPQKDKWSLCSTSEKDIPSVMRRLISSS
ncbi:hypothetical protein E2C01_032990 [Portunus trituberculatus]|uniref:Uncharacterized protein n=1 Tax=Portunus trituberculatus TaxID=210409 RepID=A0A5B7F300_PORTR|nr:hypothetical protein [Portunus trituberculatus]